MQFSAYQPVDLIFKLIVPENISIPRQAPKAFGAVKILYVLRIFLLK